jgi:N-methylhydantoinase B/oxoprolinase/acetone carboxylase alpha subunit
VQTIGARFAHDLITLDYAAEMGCKACGSAGGGCQFLGTAGGRVEIALADGRRLHPKSRDTIHPGDRLIVRYAGGGGYGDPRSRTREAVERDLRDGYISPESARRDYGLDA